MRIDWPEPNWTSVEIDRIGIVDATPTQSSAAPEGWIPGAGVGDANYAGNPYYFKPGGGIHWGPPPKPETVTVDRARFERLLHQAWLYETEYQSTLHPGDLDPLP